QLRGIGVKVEKGVVEVDVEVVPGKSSIDMEPARHCRRKHHPVPRMRVVVGIGRSEQDLCVAAETGAVEDLWGGGSDLVRAGLGRLRQVGEPVPRVLSTHWFLLHGPGIAGADAAMPGFAAGRVVGPRSGILRAVWTQLFRSA